MTQIWHIHEWCSFVICGFQPMQCTFMLKKKKKRRIVSEHSYGFIPVQILHHESRNSTVCVITAAFSLGRLHDPGVLAILGFSNLASSRSLASSQLLESLRVLASPCYLASSRSMTSIHTELPSASQRDRFNEVLKKIWQKAPKAHRYFWIYYDLTSLPILAIQE